MNLAISLICYVLSFFYFCKSNKRYALILTTTGFLFQLIYFVKRWIEVKHIPTSNMFEFITFLSVCMVAFFLILVYLYRIDWIGFFVMPIVILILGYAMVFPSEMQPLIPALNSIWLKIHVTGAAMGYACFGISFVIALLYLTKCAPSKSLECVFFFLCTVFGFVIISLTFKGLDYQVDFSNVDNHGDFRSNIEGEFYRLPPIFVSSKLKGDRLISVPFTVKAAKKVNSLTWALIAGACLYVLLRVFMKKPICFFLSQFMTKLKAEELDEMCYRCIVIGFPIFTLGGLIFAMIWAHQAWGRFWGWDPKEIWALITWLYYSGYLHLRLSKGWHGVKSAWLSVIGFLIVVFTLVGVNLIISGLHSYAGA